MPFGGDVLTEIPAGRRAAHAPAGSVSTSLVDAAGFHPGLACGTEAKAPAIDAQWRVLRKPAWGAMEHMDAPADEWPARLGRPISDPDPIPRRNVDPNFSLSKCGFGSLGNLELQSRTDTKTQNRFSSTDIAVRGLTDQLYEKVIRKASAGRWQPDGK
ncbi:MAG: hypothetical protein ACLPLP_25995 [Mycobacterium sp.]